MVCACVLMLHGARLSDAADDRKTPLDLVPPHAQSHMAGLLRRVHELLQPVAAEDEPLPSLSTVAILAISVWPAHHARACALLARLAAQSGSADSVMRSVALAQLLLHTPRTPQLNSCLALVAFSLSSRITQDGGHDELVGSDGPDGPSTLEAEKHDALHAALWRGVRSALLPPVRQYFGGETCR